MAHVVTDKCQRCKFTDCVEVCPVACFYELDQQLVIHPEDCIDCTACVEVCPVEAIYAEASVPQEYQASIQFNSAEAQGAKTKTPFEFAVSSIRVLDGSTDGSRQLAQAIARMGQPLYQCQPPTGFPDRADHWMSNGAVVERLNFAVALSANRIPGTTVRIDDSMKSIALKLGSPEFQKR